MKKSFITPLGLIYGKDQCFLKLSLSELLQYIDKDLYHLTVQSSIFNLNKMNNNIISWIIMNNISSGIVSVILLFKVLVMIYSSIPFSSRRLLIYCKSLRIKGSFPHILRFWIFKRNSWKIFSSNKNQIEIKILLMYLVLRND